MIKKTLIFIALASLLNFASCIRDPLPPCDNPSEVTLVVHTYQHWLENIPYKTKAEDLQVMYQIKIFKSGETTDPVLDRTLYNDDLSRQDFTVDIPLYEGSYDVYVWSDLSDSSNPTGIFYDSSDFNAISYRKPYTADTDNKDAFRGFTSFKVKKDTADQFIVNLERPLAKYILIATDLEDFLTTAATNNVDLSKYTAKITYPNFMPSVFDNFTNKPVNSETNISYEGPISVTDDEVIVGFDYVMVNGGEASIQVEVEIFDENGVQTSGTSTFTVPLDRNHITIVSGNFLTSSVNGNVNIDPSFKDHFDIEI